MTIAGWEETIDTFLTKVATDEPVHVQEIVEVLCALSAQIAGSPLHDTSRHAADCFCREKARTTDAEGTFRNDGATIAYIINATRIRLSIEVSEMNRRVDALLNKRQDAPWPSELTAWERRELIRRLEATL